MRFYSDLLKKPFNSVSELEKAEKEYNAEREEAFAAKNKIEEAKAEWYKAQEEEKKARKKYYDLSEEYAKSTNAKEFDFNWLFPANFFFDF